MSKLLQQREQMVFPPQVATTDTSWAYIHSFNLRPFNVQDLDAQNYKISGAGGQNALQGSGAPQGKSVKKEPIDRFASIIDAEDPRFEKQRKENFKSWESGVQNLCASMSRSIDAFYDRKTEVYHNIVHSAIARRDDSIPQVDQNEMTEEIKDLALAPWIFQSLPGTKPSQQWPQSLQSLSERLDSLPPCQLWNEPLDLICGGPEFFEQARKFITDSGEKINAQNDEQVIEDLIKDASQAIGCLFGISVQMGNNEKIIETLDLIDQFSKQCSMSDAIFELTKPRLQKYLQQMKEMVEAQKSLHYMQSSSTSGVIAIAKYISFVNLNEYYSSITTDGDYIYLYISMAQRGAMYKIGTGEGGTLAGKVYLNVPTDREGEITWVYCQGKLYSRRANEELGHIVIIDPITFKQEGMAKLFAGEAFQTPVAQSINRYYPLLTDGNNLFAVTMSIVKKRRRVKDTMRKQYQSLQEEKKKKKEEIKAALEKKESAVEKKPNAKESRKKQREERDKQQQLNKESSKIKDQLAKEDSEQLKKKELSRKAVKDQKAEIMKKAQEIKAKEAAAAGAANEENKEQQQQQQEPDQYKVCEFYLHEFDVQNQSDEDLTVQELIKNEFVIELFDSFSGFFSYQECHRALKFNSNDIAAAASWLVEEGEKERGKKSFIKKRSVLLAESEILSEQQTKKHEVDIVVKQDSILYPTNITTGKWTINDGYVAFHNLVTDNGYIKVFSTNEQDIKILNQKPEKKSQPEESPQVSEERVEEKTETESVSESIATDSIIDEPIKEEEMFEDVKLYGTLVKTIKLQRNLDYNHNTYLIYDHTYKKFYFMLIASNNRYIAVANDLQSMESLLKGFSEQIDNNEEINDIVKVETKSFNEFAILTLKILLDTNKNRFVMPWRWRPWSNLYLQVLQQWGSDQLEMGGENEHNRGSNEYRKKQLHKLTSRLEKVALREKQLYREAIGIQLDEKAFQKRQQSVKQYHDQQKKENQLRKNDQDEKKKQKKEPKPQNWGLFGSPGAQPAKSSSQNSELVLPKEKINMAREVKKLFAYCTIGNAHSLEILFNLLKKSQDNKIQYKLLLDHILDWVLYADILVSLYNTDLLDVVYDHLIGQLKKNAFDDKIIQQVIWRILIIGWPIFIRNTQKQFEIFNMILDCSIQQSQFNSQFHDSSLQPLNKQNSESQQQQSVPQKKENYYTKLLYGDLPPMQLFYLRFFNYHASFYPLEILNQSKVISEVILIDKYEYGFKEDKKEKEETIEKEKAYKVILPKYHKFKSEIDCFQYRHTDIPFAECKEFYEKEVDIGLISHNYFGVPLFLLFTGNFELVEDYESLRELPPLEKLLSIYSDKKLEMNDITDKKTLYELQLSELHNLRSDHESQANILIGKFQEIIRKTVENDKDIWDDQFHPYIMSTFNNLIRQSLAQVDWSRSKFCQLSVDIARFIEEVLSLYMKKVNYFKTEPKPYMLEWLNHIQELTIIVLSMSYSVIDYDTFTYFAKECLKPMTKVLEMLKQVFQITKEEPNQGKNESLLDKAYVILSEGSDFTSEKVFETPHPYPRGENYQKDQISVPKAIAFSIELDKRCSTEFNSDYLVIQSQDHAFWVNDSFGTHIRFYGKPQVKYPFMILGNKINIEFRSYPHGKKGQQNQSYQFKYRHYKGGPPGQAQQSEDVMLRWGFRLIIRPIYSEPSYMLSGNIKVIQALIINLIQKEVMTQMFKRLGGENQIKNIVSLMTHLVQITSKFSRAVTQADIDLIDQATGKISTDQNENLTKYMNWHLFKGGIRTKVIDQIHNPKALDEVFMKNDELKEIKQQEKIKALEDYKDPLQEQQKIAKRKASTSLIVEGDKLEIEEFKPNEEFWTYETRSLIKDREFLESVNKKIRELVPYTITYINEKRRPNFKKDYQEEWLNVEYTLILTMLYHSTSIEETRRFLQNQKSSSPSAQNAQIEEKLKLIGSQVNEVLGWMQSRLQGEQDYQTMLLDIVEASQKYITKIITKKREEEEQKKIKAAEEEEKLRQQKEIEEEEKRKRLEEEKKEGPKIDAQSATQQEKKKGPQVSKDNKVNKVKRKKVIKMSQIDVSKLKKDKKKKSQKEKNVSAQKQGEKKEEILKDELKKPDDSIIQEDKKEEEQKQKIKYLELSKLEENEIKNKIYNQVYEDFLQFYQGNQDKVKPLCLLLNIQFNPEDPNESLKAIFKRVKAKLKTLIDFDGDLPLRESLDIEELKLESPYKEISKEVKARLLFLLELKPSVDYHSKVINVDIQQIKKRIQDHKILMSSSVINDDQSSSHQMLTESSIPEEDSDILEPLDVKRSQSVQISLQPSLHGIAGVSQALIAQQNNMKEEDIVNWIDNYRKWRQWNRQHKMIHRGQLGVADILEEDLTSPFCSPLYSVVAFAKSSKILNPDKLRQIFMNQQVKAGFRVYGLQIQEKLLSLVWNSPFQRLIWGNVSQTLLESTFNHIETCGETLAQSINESSRLLIRQLMANVVQSRRNIDQLIQMKIAQTHQEQQQKMAQSQQQAQMYLTQAEKIKQQQQMQLKASYSIDEWIQYEQIKRLLNTLNDIRVILNNIFTREYVLESLRQGQNQLKDLKNSKKSEEQLNFDTIKDFLKSVVFLMLLFTSGSSHIFSKSSQQSTTKMQFSIAHCCKLILNQFMSDKSMMRSSETQRLLQEMLLDIVVEQLERLCGLNKIEDPNKPQNEANRPGRRLGRHQNQEEIVSLLKLLSEVIRISNDHQQQVLSLQSLQPGVPDQQVQETYFLSEGSDKVMRCASILAFMMHNIEVPVVMRQTIKCARLFFKLVDFKKLKLHAIPLDQYENSFFKDVSNNQFLIETLKQVGQKISNTQEKREEKKANEEEKQYVVYANINSSEEDFSFLITALYHWENLYPTFTQDLPKDPADIVVKSKPKEEAKKEEEQDSQAALLLQQIQEADSNVDLQELINIQRQQIQQNNGAARGGRGGRGGGPNMGGRGGGGLRPYIPPQFERQPTYAEALQRNQKSSQIFGQGPKAGVEPQRPSVFNSIYQYQSGIPLAGIQNIGINKLDQLYEEIIKSTWEDCKEEDTPEEKQRKLNEKNYNTRISVHLKDAIQLAAILYTRYSAPLTEPMPFKKALEFSNLIKKAYKGILEPVQINPFIKPENKEKKLSNQKSVAQNFPLLMKTIDVPKKAKDLPPGAGAPIVIAPKRLIVSLAEKRVAQKYEQIVETRTTSLKQLEKNPIEGFNCNVISQGIRRQGASISVIIQQFIQLLRSLIHSSKQGSLDQQVSQFQMDISFQKQKQILKIQQQQENIQQEMIQMINSSIDKLASQKWSEFSTSDQQILFGILALIGGWAPPMRTGQPVQVEINNQWVDAIIVDDGLGKKRISVILEDDDTLQIQRVPIAKARPHQKFEWPFEGSLSQQIDQKKLCLAITNVYNQVDDINHESAQQCKMLNERFLILMLLKVSSQIKWHFMDVNDDIFKKFMEILTQITKEHQSEEDKTKVYWEKALIDSWERLIDKDEEKNHDFFVLRENLLEKPLKEEEKKNDTGLDRVQSRISSSGRLQKEAQYQDSEFVQPLSSYLKGLPEPVPKKNSSEAALKLLAYWEKNIIPKIIEFVRTTYKPWEMEFYFEQLRHHLRHGDAQKALEDALTMCERKLPQGCIVPDDNYDWTAKMVDECIVDSWALAKFKTQRHHQQNQQNQQAQAGHGQSGETSFPLLNKLINYGVDEIVVLIKAVDLRANVVMAEYQDPDTMQVHSIWIPCSHLNDLHNPLPPRAVGYTTKTLKKSFEYSVSKIDQIYARQTLIQFFHAFQNQQTTNIIQLPSADMQLQEIISWSVWEEFSSAPITGWMKDLNCAIPLSTNKDTNSKAQDSLNTTQISTDSSQVNNLQEVVIESSEKIVFEQLLNMQSNSSQVPQQATLQLIKNLFERTINSIDESIPESQDVKIVKDIVEWCIMNWYNISERIRSDRAVFDLCQHNEFFIDKDGKQEDKVGQLLPLHELVQSEESSSAIGTLLMFKKSGAHLTPTSKIQFYSDQNKVNLVSEISAGSEGKRDLPPLLLNHGTVWVHFDPGTTALLPKHQQIDQKSSLPCAMVQIPNTWTVCCWLTETITNALLANSKINVKFTIEIYQKLIEALTLFYEEAKAPSLLKSIIFTLLSRLIIKLRYLYSLQPENIESPQENLRNHFKRLFINQEFIGTLLSELLLHKEQEEQNLSNSGQQILYPAFVQDCVELILTMMMPTVQNAKIQSYKELFGDNSKLEMPSWIQPLIKATYFMHYFSGQMPLSLDILKEIYSETKLNHSQLDQIIVVQGIPENEKYSKEWIKSEIIKLISESGARILNPETDIIFTSEGGKVVIIVDGIDHMSYVKDEENNQEHIEEIESEDSNDDDWEDVDNKPKPQEQEEEKEEELLPQTYNCPACTLENPIDVAACDICATPKPPMEVLIAEFQAKLNIDKPPKKEEEKADEVAEKSQTLLKLEILAIKISRIISKEERRVIKEQKKKEEEERKAKEEEEKKQKEEEEKKKKEEEEIAKKEQEGKKDAEKPKEILGPKMPEIKALKKIGKQAIQVVEGENFIANSLSEDIYNLNDIPKDDESDNSLDENDLAGAGRFRSEQQQKLIEMGIDPAIIDSDPDLAQAIAESMLAEEQLSRQQSEQKAKEEEEKKKKEKEEEEKKKKKEEEEKRKAEGIEEPQKPQKIKYTKLKVLVGKEPLLEDMECSRLVYKILRDRIKDNSEENQDGFQFSRKMIDILQKIHQNFQILPIEDLSIPQNQLLEDFDLTKATIRDSTFEEFLMKCSLLVDADIILFMSFLETQGYDYWLQRVAFPTYNPDKASSQQHLNVQILEKLKTFIEIEMCKESKGVVHLHPTNLRLISKMDESTLSEKEKPINYYNDSLIGANYIEIHEKMTLADVRYQWALLKIFNKYLAPTVPYINTSQSISDIPHNTIPMKLSVYMSFTRNLCLMNVKFDLRHLILEKTSVQREHAPKLYFERLKLAHKNRENEEGDENGLQSSPKPIREQAQGQDGLAGGRSKDKRQQEFMFVQAFEQIKEMDLALLRPKKPQGAEPHLSFHIIFRGEHVVGEAGPYRQYFADISQELQPNNLAINPHQKLLNLLYPSPNNRDKQNIGKGKFVLSPSKNSSQDLSLYEFLGILMGVCIRTGAHLNLDLPQFVWKQLAGQKINHEDLIEIDIGFWKILSFMLTTNKKLYEESIFETWSVTLSDETLVELRENGKEQRVLYEERVEYINQALYTRMKECQIQCEAIKRGIAKIVPEALLNMVTYNELETWVCGKAIVDIDLLKRHTKYGGDKKTTILNEESRRIKWFWEVLREFSEEDKQKFIKFCWGQQRLPSNDEEFERRQVRFMIKPAMKTNQGDGALPKADTCFFNFELPDYSSKEIMKEKILLAIHTDSDSMNAEAEHVNLNQDNMGDGDHSYDEEY